MTQTLIKADHLSLVYPIYSVRAQSLRNTVMNMAVGGRLMRNAQDVVQVSALNNVSFAVNEGDRLGVMGHNGSGKTTLLKVLAGVYEPTSGRLDIHGRISSMIDISFGLDAEATGIENIVRMGRLRGMTGKQIKSRMDEIVEFSEIGSFVGLPMKTYSAGMQMRLVFSVATSFDPEILLLDEWLGAGDIGFLEKAKERMNSLVEKSRALVLASHSIDLIGAVCNKLLVMNGGQVEYFGPTKDYAHPALRTA
jgi:lipopolysaccharide transport system ATP-binding protein